MASQLRVDEIIASTGSSVAIGTAGGSVTLAGDFTVDTSKGLNVGTGATIFSPSSNVLTLGTNNAERVRIDSSGNVGIGLTNPQTALVVERDWVNNYGSINIKSSSDVLSGVGFRTDGGYAGGFIYRDGTTGNFFELNAQGSREIRALLNGSEALRIDTSGRLLVGTNSASYTATAVFEGNSGSSANQGQIHLQKGNTTVADSTILGIVRFGATGDRRGADIRGVGDGTWTADSSHPTSLLFMTTAASATAPTERLRINASGAMGLGVVPEPQGSGFINFQFGGLGNLGATSSQSAGGAIYLYNNIYRATAGQWRYLVTDEATRYQALNGRHQFDIAPSGTADTEANFAEKVRIDTDGLKFNGDTAAANALDDYEEGTWTPTLGITTPGNSSFGYSQQTGKYVKVGKIVYFTLDIRLNSFSRGTGTGGIRVQGLPIVPVDTNNYARANGFAQLYNWNYASTDDQIPIYSVIQDNGITAIDLVLHRENNTTANIGDPSSNSMVFISGTYETAS